MMTSFANRTSEACFSALQLDRFLAGEMTDGEAERVRAHAALCARCTSAVQSLRAASDEALPPLRVVPLAPRSRTALRAVAAAVGVAAAASFLTIVQPFGPRGTRAKGSGFALSMYVDHRGEVRRVGSGEAVAPGDAVRFAVSTPAEAYVAVLSLDAKGHASIYFPQGGRAQPVPPGVDVPLPLGTRLDDTVGEERIVGIFCQSAVELEPLRAHLERGALVLPDGCQETRWSFVKR